MRHESFRKALISFSAVMLAALTCGEVCSAAQAGAAGETRITYRRIFKDSNPEFIQVQVNQAGAANYDIRSLSDEPAPQTFAVGPALAAKIFELAGQLNNFRGQQLDVKRRIANLGEKTLRYERGAEASETKFNYTINREASQLMMIFEGLARQQEHFETLERRLKYDRLGLQKALFNFETDLNRRVLPEPERLVPLLDKIAADEKVVDVVRQRSRSLAERLRANS